MTESYGMCVFCRIVDGRNDATIVREWDDALAIVPLNPVTPGHTLILPKVHVETFFSSPDVSAATMRHVAEMVHGVERHHDPNDYNVITSAGPLATQTIMHLHVHLVPRRPKDGLALPWNTALVYDRGFKFGLRAAQRARELAEEHGLVVND